MHGGEGHECMGARGVVGSGRWVVEGGGSGSLSTSASGCERPE